MRNAILVSCLLVSVSLTGCASLGLSRGGSAGAGVTAEAAELGNGLIAQSQAGRALPAEARARGLQAEYQALQFGLAGQPVAWTGGGVSGQVVPTQLYRIGSQDCRGYTQTFQTARGAVKEIGTACRTQAGNWKPVA